MSPSAVPLSSSLADQSGRPGLRPGRVIALIGALLVATAMLGCGYFIASLYQSEVTAIRNRLEIPAQAMAHSFDAIVRNADKTLRGVQSALQNRPDAQWGQPVLRERLLNPESLIVAVIRVAVYDAGGNPIISSLRDPAREPAVGNR